MKSSTTRHESALHRLFEAMGIEEEGTWPVTIR